MKKREGYKTMRECMNATMHECLEPAAGCQSPLASHQLHREINLLMMNDYLFDAHNASISPESYRDHRAVFIASADCWLKPTAIDNSLSTGEGEGTPQRGEISITPGKEESRNFGTNPGWSAPTTSCPLFSAPALATGNIAVPFMGRTGNTLSTTGLQPHTIWLKPVLIASGDRWLKPTAIDSLSRPDIPGVGRALKSLSRPEASGFGRRYNNSPGCNPGLSASTTSCPPISAPALASEKLINDCRLTIDDCRTDATTPVYNFLFLIFYSLFPENNKHQITNTESGNLRTPQRGEISITPGKEERRNPGLGAPNKSCQQFSAPNPVANEGYKSQSGRVNTLSGWVTTLSDSRENQSGWVVTLSGSQKTLSGRLAGLSDFEKNATGRVNTLSDRVEPQSGSQKMLSGKGFNFLMINDYLLIRENQEHRITNNESGGLTPALSQGEGARTPRRGEILITPGKEESRNFGTNPGWSAPTIPAPPFSAPALNDLTPTLPMKRDKFSQGEGAGRALKSLSRNIGRQLISAPDEMSGQAQGNALGKQAPTTSCPPFSAPNPVANEGYKSQSGRVNTLSGWVTTLSDSWENQSGWLATLSGNLTGLSGFEKNTTGRVNTLSDRVKPQSGSRNFLFRRVGNQQGSQKPQSGKGINLLMMNDYLLIRENMEHRITNNESGSLSAPQRGEISITPGFNPGWGAPTTSCPPISAPALATPTRLAVLNRLALIKVLATGEMWLKPTACPVPKLRDTGEIEREIQFSIYQSLSLFARRGTGEGPVIHRGQAVRACLLPLLPTLTTNASAFFRHGLQSFN